MKPSRPLSWHAAGIVIGLLGVCLRVLAIFAAIGAGYYVYSRFGVDWFRVFVFAAMAATLDLELRRIDREYPPDDPEAGQ